MSNKMITIVEKGNNTSHLTCMLIALFYNNSNFYTNMLESIPTNIKLTYLQELIKNNFVEPLRKNTLITNAIINEIKNTLFLTNLINKSEFLNNINLLSLYKILNSTNICTEYINNNNTVQIPFIDLSVPKTSELVNLTNITKKWICETLMPNNNDIELKKVPSILPIYLNRHSENQYLDTSIDIMYQMKPFIKLDKFSNVTMSIHSIICQDKTNKYYSVLLENKKWILFSDQMIPSFKEINITNKDFINKIRREVVFVFYKYDDLFI